MTLTAEDIAEQLRQAKERGAWEGEIKAKLEMLLAQGVATSSGMADIRGMLQAQSNQITEVRVGLNTNRDDLADTKKRLDRVENEYVTRSDLEEILKPLKAVADRLNNWVWQAAFAGVSGSALTLGGGYLILKVSGVVP